MSRKEALQALLRDAKRQSEELGFQDEFIAVEDILSRQIAILKALIAEADQ